MGTDDIKKLVTALLDALDWDDDTAEANMEAFVDAIVNDERITRFNIDHLAQALVDSIAPLTIEVANRLSEEHQ